MLWLFAGPVLAAPPHPLDPLTAGELASLKTILESSGAFSANTYFAWIELQEPTKELVKQYIPNAFFPRMVHLSAVDYEKKTSFSVAVDLQARQITSVVDLKDLQPGMTKRDVEIATGILDNDPQVRAALLRRGLNIPGRLSDSVKMLNETIGDDPSLSNIHSRLMRVLFLSDHVVRLVDEPGEPIRKVPHDGPQDLCHKLRCTIHR